ncbi:hypothetical protein Aau02nite_08800 [Amorphoplanes auranticolor]|uniref:Uncharacterized protein n=2 Tax=Actinoplanes auranticolor TaxID=47988 RepID=A0A919S3H6_9ACTN|nr:hypothetical protein Aau02nite_08800 [Actinoplanes auranticolor]
MDQPVAVAVSDGSVAVAATLAGRSGTAVIGRLDDTGLKKHIPIGTRDARRLSMAVDGSPVTLRPGSGRYRRGSYQVTVVHGAVTYRFRPKSPDVSRLTRDGRRLGDFELTTAGTVDITWHEEAAAEVSVTDAAVGTVLGAASGTGAQFFLLMLLDLLGQVPDRRVPLSSRRPGCSTGRRWRRTRRPRPPCATCS